MQEKQKRAGTRRSGTGREGGRDKVGEPVDIKSVGGEGRLASPCLIPIILTHTGQHSLLMFQSEEEGPLVDWEEYRVYWEGYRLEWEGYRLK